MSSSSISAAATRGSVRRWPAISRCSFFESVPLLALCGTFGLKIAVQAHELSPSLGIRFGELAAAFGGFLLQWFRELGEFRAVVEATATYRWFHQLVSPLGTVLLAHPDLLRAIVQRRSKTDRLGVQLLANLLRINQIPLSYIPSDEYQLLRDVSRYRARLGRGLASVKTSLRALLTRHNLVRPTLTCSGSRGAGGSCGIRVRGTGRARGRRVPTASRSCGRRRRAAAS
ncbi:MAG: transposase [Planctomycetaceae bacterium]|nr:transposase [Planctomycetaceae bacterium]